MAKKTNIMKIIWVSGIFIILIMILILVVIYKVKYEDMAYNMNKLTLWFNYDKILKSFINF